MRSPKNNQNGISSIAAISAIAALGAVMVVLVIITSNSFGSKAANNNPPATTDDQQQATTSSNEPPYIRIPDNSQIYNNDTYKFLFAYPDSFGDLTAKSSDTSVSGTSFFQAESGLASQKPVGNGTAFMNGRLTAYVYSKDNFKVSVNSQDVQVAPTVTGNDITWKVVSRGSSSQDLAVGSSYSVKSTKSQTSIPVFDFTYKPSGALAIGRWVFAAGNNYVMVSLPSISKPTGENLTDTDIAAYTIIGNNIAKTVRVQSTTSTDKATDDSTTD